MNSYSHLHIGLVLLHALKKEYGIKLPKAAFVWGNIRPDFSIKYIKKPHYYNDSYPEIKCMLKELIESGIENKSARALADRLGVICHYFCDFFCYAHHQDFSGKFKQHVYYEAGLNHYIRKRMPALKTLSWLKSEELPLDLEELFMSLEAQHRQYLSFCPNFGLDMICSLQACTEVLSRTLQIIFEKNSLSKPEIRYFAAKI